MKQRIKVIKRDSVAVSKVEEQAEALPTHETLRTVARAAERAVSGWVKEYFDIKEADRRKAIEVLQGGKIDVV